MAIASITRRWSDGESLRIAIEVDDSFPDVVAEARANARALYADAMDITIASDVAAADEDDGA